MITPDSPWGMFSLGFVIGAGAGAVGLAHVAGRIECDCEKEVEQTHGLKVPRTNPSDKTCSMCGESGLVWGLNDIGKWRLCTSAAGDMHQCPEHQP